MSAREAHSLRGAGDVLRGGEALIGDSAALTKIRQDIRLFARTDSSILITGETGAGKEVVAELIHLNSARADAQFVALNCASLADSLFESEIFGHERGAFTGADRQRAGHLEHANGGTVFLDEIGELKMEAQPKLLRVLEKRQTYRVGGRELIRLDIRILAATNRDLRELVRREEFRQDLFYRLQVCEIHVPPLRERIEDVIPIAEHLLQEQYRRLGISLPGMSTRVRKALQRHTWPGNVRELRNVIERIVAWRPERMIEHQHLPDDFRRDLESSDEERRQIMDALEKAHWNKTNAAEALGLGRTTLYRKLKELGIEY